MFKNFFFLFWKYFRKTHTNTIHAFEHTTKNAYHHKYPKKIKFYGFCFFSFSFIYRISSLHWDYISKMVTLEARQMHPNPNVQLFICVYTCIWFSIYLLLLCCCVLFFLFFFDTRILVLWTVKERQISMHFSINNKAIFVIFRLIYSFSGFFFIFLLYHICLCICVFSPIKLLVYTECVLVSFLSFWTNKLRIIVVSAVILFFIFPY